MSGKPGPSAKVVPAQLGFLAIYNPSLGTTDETIHDQIVYYSSPETRKKRRSRTKTPEDVSKEEQNERLRQIGLAQGMVEFGRTFSDGKSVDAIETEKARIILHELEAGWWLLASIDLTRLPLSDSKLTSINAPTESETAVEYSSREVKPPELLLQDLLRAHSTFLLHHASSMSALFVRTGRLKFVGILGRYWDGYLSSWNVLLHGNPAVNVYGGIKLASSGELGMGVGEEDRGSGERAVLEGFVERIDGLVDLVVSRFGNPNPMAVREKGPKEPHQPPIAPSQPWLGTGAEPALEDGAIFLGVGALSRHSLRDVTHWMEDLYSWGSNAYGVTENPTSTRRSRKKKTSDTTSNKKFSSPNSSTILAPPQPAIQSEQQLRESHSGSGNSHAQDESHLRNVSPTEAHATSPSRTLERRKSEQKHPLTRRTSSHSSSSSGVGQSSTFMNYLKLGYGTHWTLGSNSAKVPSVVASEAAKTEAETAHQLANGNITDIQNHDIPSRNRTSSPTRQPQKTATGHYLVGLLGEIEDEHLQEAEHAEETEDDDRGENESGNLRTLVRTVTVELERESDARAEADISIDLSTNDNSHASSQYGGSQRTGTSHTSFESQDRNKTKKLRVVVYVSQPFIFTFLFELHTDSLALSSLYRSLHHQINSLLRSLLISTKHCLSRPELSTTSAEDTKTPIYDLIWDPKSLTISATIPNIPDPSFKTSKMPAWSRIEALSTHSQILNTFTAAHSDRSELERTCKTSRGYWVVWTRIPDPDATPSSKPSSSNTRSVSPLPNSRSPQPEANSSTKNVQTLSVNASSINKSAYSGPAHPFLDIPSAGASRLPMDKEIFLVRRASDYVAGSSTNRFASGSSRAVDIGWGSAPAKLAQGIGVDTKRYIEGLLNMNR